MIATLYRRRHHLLRVRLRLLVIILYGNTNANTHTPISHLAIGPNIYRSVLKCSHHCMAWWNANLIRSFLWMLAPFMLILSGRKREHERKRKNCRRNEAETTKSVNNTHRNVRRISFFLLDMVTDDEHVKAWTKTNERMKRKKKEQRLMWMKWMPMKMACVCVWNVDGNIFWLFLAGPGVGVDSWFDAGDEHIMKFCDRFHINTNNNWCIGALDIKKEVRQTPTRSALTLLMAATEHKLCMKYAKSSL